MGVPGGYMAGDVADAADAIETLPVGAGICHRYRSEYRSSRQRPPGSVRGAVSNFRPDRDWCQAAHDIATDFV